MVRNSGADGGSVEASCPIRKFLLICLGRDFVCVLFCSDFSFEMPGEQFPPFAIRPSLDEIKGALITGTDAQVIEKVQLFIVSRRFLQADELSASFSSGSLGVQKVYESHQIDRNLFVAFRALQRTMERSQSLDWSSIESDDDILSAWKGMLASARYLRTGAWEELDSTKYEMPVVVPYSVRDFLDKEAPQLDGKYDGAVAGIEGEALQKVLRHLLVEQAGINDKLNRLMNREEEKGRALVDQARILGRVDAGIASLEGRVLGHSPAEESECVVVGTVGGKERGWTGGRGAGPNLSETEFDRGQKGRKRTDEPLSRNTPEEPQAREVGPDSRSNDPYPLHRVPVVGISRGVSATATELNRSEVVPGSNLGSCAPQRYRISIGPLSSEQKNQVSQPAPAEEGEQGRFPTLLPRPSTGLQNVYDNTTEQRLCADEEGAIPVPYYAKPGEISVPVFSGREEDWFAFRLSFELYLSSKRAFDVASQSRILVNSLKGELQSEYCQRFQAARGGWFALNEYWRQLDERFSQKSVQDFEADPEGFIKAHPWDGKEWSLDGFLTQVAQRCAQFHKDELPLAKSMAAKLVFLRGLPSELLHELNQKIRARPELEQMTKDLDMLCAQVHDLFQEYKACHAEVPWMRNRGGIFRENRTQETGRTGFVTKSVDFSRASSSSIRGDRERGWTRSGSKDRNDRRNRNRSGARSNGRDGSADSRNSDGGRRRNDRSFGAGNSSPAPQRSNSPTLTPVSTSTPGTDRSRPCFSCGGVGHIARECPNARKSENKANKPNFSRGSLKSAEVHGQSDDAQNECSSPRSSDDEGTNEKYFSEENSPYWSRDEDFESFENEVSGHAEDTFREKGSPSGQLKD